MNGGEWSRSRFWLGHFLYSRHQRRQVAWDGFSEAGVGLPAPLASWLARQAGRPDDADRRLVQHALRHHTDDPAYIQALRLVAKERQLHRELCARLTPAPAAKDEHNAVMGFCRRQLGPRFEFSVGLLDDLIAVTLLQGMPSCGADNAGRAVVGILTAEKRAHIIFAAERLTELYADFNFVRRNLRRWRLRLMCLTLAGFVAVRDGGAIRAMGRSRRVFVLDVWRHFAVLLERMVPYRRETLLAALMNQREQRYDQPAKLL